MAPTEYMTVGPFMLTKTITPDANEYSLFHMTKVTKMTIETPSETPPVSSVSDVLVLGAAVYIVVVVATNVLIWYLQRPTSRRRQNDN